MDIYEKRQQSKNNAERYRQAARRMTGGTVNPMTTPNEVGEEGAFVEVIIWVPRLEMENER